MKRSSTAAKLILPGLILLLALAVGLLLAFRPGQPEPVAPRTERVAVTVLDVEAVRLDDRIVLPGQVAAFDDVTVSAEQGGRITAIKAREGDRVSAGDPLIRIDDRLWQTALRQAELRDRDARRERDRLEALSRDGAVPQRELEAVQTAAESARLALEDARVQLERCMPTAPIDGVVESRFVSLGAFVNPGQPIARLLSLDRVKITFDLPERDVAGLRVGDQCRVRLDALRDVVVTGRVAMVSFAARPSNNAFAVELEAANPGERIRPGMIARVDVLRGTRDAVVLLPLQAVVPMEGETVVYLEADGHAVRRIVRIAEIIDSKAVVREGVQPGDRVILDGNRNVLDGTPVEVKPEWEPRPFSQF